MDENQDPNLRPNPNAQQGEPSPKKRPPSQKRVKKRRPPQKSQQNRSSKLALDPKFVGPAILGVGLLLFILVGYFAYQKLSPQTDEEVISEEEVASFKKASGVNRAAGEKAPEKKSYKRQKSISHKEMAGLWETNLKKGKALLEMEKGIYRLIIIDSDEAGTRYFSNGTYEIQDDLVLLSPNPKWGPPKNDNFSYNTLTSTRFGVVGAKYKGKLIWQKPPTRGLKTYLPPYNAILDLAKDDIAVWSRLE